MKLKGRDDLISEGNSDGDLVYIGIYTSRICNQACIYCFESAGEKATGETTLEERKRTIDEAEELGARAMFIAGAGEPTLDPLFAPLLRYAYKKKLTTLLYTNGTLINRDMARFFYAYDVTPIVKLESLDKKVHNTLTGREWSYRKTMAGISNLLSSGYGKIQNGYTRIGVAALYTKPNLKGLQKLKDWCLSKGILLMVDWLAMKGRAFENETEIKPKTEEILYHKNLLNLDEESAGNVVTGNCIFWRYGLTIDHFGYARPCTEMETRTIGNIREFSLMKLNEIKNQLFPKRSGCFTCIFKDTHYRNLREE